MARLLKTKLSTQEVALFLSVARKLFAWGYQKEARHYWKQVLLSDPRDQESRLYLRYTKRRTKPEDAQDLRASQWENSGLFRSGELFETAEHSLWFEEEDLSGSFPVFVQDESSPSIEGLGHKHTPLPTMQSPLNSPSPYAPHTPMPRYQVPKVKSKTAPFEAFSPPEDSPLKNSMMDMKPFVPPSPAPAVFDRTEEEDRHPTTYSLEDLLEVDLDLELAACLIDLEDDD